MAGSHCMALHIQEQAQAYSFPGRDREGWLACIIGAGARQGSRLTAYSSTSECMDREGWLVSMMVKVSLDGYCYFRDLG